MFGRAPRIPTPFEKSVNCQSADRRARQEDENHQEVVGEIGDHRIFKAGVHDDKRHKNRQCQEGERRRNEKYHVPDTSAGPSILTNFRRNLLLWQIDHISGIITFSPWSSLLPCLAPGRAGVGPGGWRAAIASKVLVALPRHYFR